MIPDHRSTKLSQEALVGVKCMWKRGFCASHALTSGCLRYTTAAELTNALAEAKAQDRMSRKLEQFARYDVVILDELGYVPFDKHGADLLFGFITRVYERRTLTVTTNLPFAGWAQAPAGADHDVVGLPRFDRDFKHILLGRAPAAPPGNEDLRQSGAGGTARVSFAAATAEGSHVGDTERCDETAEHEFGDPASTSSIQREAHRSAHHPRRATCRSTRPPHTRPRFTSANCDASSTLPPGSWPSRC